MEPKYYDCDPNKNKECKKTNCIHDLKSAYPVCSHTKKKEYAIDTPRSEKNAF